MAGLMDALLNMFEKFFTSNKVYFMCCLINLKMAEGASVTDHINEFNMITTQLSSIEIELMMRFRP